MPTIHLDEYDKKIVELLQEDASISNVDLAKKIGLAPSSCLIRVKNLKENNIIKSVNAKVDEKLLGFDITCFAKVFMSPLNRQTTSVFIEEVKKIPEIVECYTITGDAAFFIRIVAKNFQYYRDFVFDKLLCVPGVSNIDTSIVVSCEKETNILPLD